MTIPRPATGRTPGPETNTAASASSRGPDAISTALAHATAGGTKTAHAHKYSAQTTANDPSNRGADPTASPLAHVGADEIVSGTGSAGSQESGARGAGDVAGNGRVGTITWGQVIGGAAERRTGAAGVRVAMVSDAQRLTTSGVHVAVVGGGLAGIAAAMALTERGVRVSLFEARPRLGGATYSFQRDGLCVDNGQHVFLKCCTAYRGLLERLGQAAQVTVQDRFEVPVLTPGGGRARLLRDRLPGPLHLTRALATYPLLSLTERAQAARAALALARLDPADPSLDGVRLGDWLAEHGQSARARRALWDLFVVSALNIAGDDAPLGLAAKVVQTALLGRADAADIGIPVVPLGELHGTPAARLLERRGAALHLGAKVAAVRPVAEGFEVQMEDAATPVDGVVVAVPPADAARLVPAEAVPGAAKWAGLGTSPIVNLHVVYERPVMGLPFAAAVDSPVQWVFDRTRTSGLDRGQYLAVSLSAADAHLDRRTEELRAEFLPALAALFPQAEHARVKEFFVTRQRQATFRQVPGTGALRPDGSSLLPGLVIAGAWTDTGWPDTMEGAVRSGLKAATSLWRQVRELRQMPVQSAARRTPG